MTEDKSKELLKNGCRRYVFGLAGSDFLQNAAEPKELKKTSIVKEISF